MRWVVSVIGRNETKGRLGARGTSSVHWPLLKPERDGERTALSW